MAQKAFTIEDMTCNHCKATITSALKQVDGVQSIDIDLKSHKATIDFDGAKTNEQQLAQAIKQAGYSPA